MKTRWPTPDFVCRARPVPLVGWLLLAVGTAVLGLALGEVLDLRQALEQDRGDVELLQRRLRVATSSRAAGPAVASGASVSLEAVRAIRRAEQHLQQPWEHALAGLERATAPGVHWLALEIEGESTRLRVEGIAPNAEAALAVVDALAVRAGWSDVVLTRLQATDTSGVVGTAVPTKDLAGQRFEVSARWAPIVPGAGANLREVRR